MMKTNFKKVMVWLWKWSFNKLFNALDKDKDGNLSPEELFELKDIIKQSYTKLKLLVKK